MKVVQMWRDSKYPKEMISYMKSVIDLVGKDNYLLLCGNAEIANILEVNSLDFDVEYNKALGSMQNPDWWKKYCVANLFMSDLIRLHYATYMEDLFYLDADFELLSVPDFSQKGQPYLIHKDFCMFYVNGRMDWFRDVIDAVTKMTPRPMCIYRYLTVLARHRESYQIDSNCSKRHDFGAEWKRLN
jgi:hypothetical protein